MCSGKELFSGGTTTIFKKSPDYEAEASTAATRRNKLIKKGEADISSAFGGYNDDFYKQRAQAYIDFAMPQLTQQYRQTGNAMTFGQANKGIMGGSASGQQKSRLNQEMGTQRQFVADTGVQQAQGLQQSVEGQKSMLMQQLYGASDPASSAQNAVATASSFRAPSVFAPLSNMFSGLINSYASSRFLETPNNPWQSPPDAGMTGSY
jgi:hypothetical protein